MSTAIIPFGERLPAYLKNANKDLAAEINKEVARPGPSYPVLSIKGKQWTIVNGDEKKTLMRPDDPDEVLQKINLAVLRANTKARVFYAAKYVEGESDGAKPTCRSDDGVVPAADVAEKQAKKCAMCPHAVWGTGNEGNGTACSVNTRLAVANPDELDKPLLLRVPAGSKKNFALAVEAGDKRGIPYNAMVMQVSFDKEAPSPKLVFKPVGLLDDGAYAKASEMHKSELVMEIVGLRPPQDQAEQGQADAGVDAAELDAAIAARTAVTKAKTEGASKPAKQPEPEKPKAENTEKAAAKAKPAPAKEAAADDGMGDLLSQLDGLLGNPDD